MIWAATWKLPPRLPPESPPEPSPFDQTLGKIIVYTQICNWQKNPLKTVKLPSKNSTGSFVNPLKPVSFPIWHWNKSLRLIRPFDEVSNFIKTKKLSITHYFTYHSRKIPTNSNSDMMHFYVRIFYPDEREFFVSLLNFLALLNELDSFKHFLYHVLLSHSRKVKYTGKIVYSTLKNSSHLEFNSESLSAPFLQWLYQYYLLCQKNGYEALLKICAPQLSTGFSSKPLTPYYKV